MQRSRHSARLFHTAKPERHATCLNRTRRQRVDADIVSGVICGHHFGKLDERAFGAMLFILSLPCAIPFLWGVPQIVALPMIALAAQMVWGREEPWLPSGIAARRINKSQADALLLAVRTCLSTASSPGASSDYYDANLSFHTALIQAAGNEHLEGVALGLGNRLIAYLAARHALPGQPERSARDHEEICRAVLDADSDLARALMVRHVNFNDVSGIDIMNGLETARR